MRHMLQMKRLNCAIYTRKSSDEGLEKEFNSLDAQREACAAFILSQKHAGWARFPISTTTAAFRAARWSARHFNGCWATSSPARFKSWSSTRSTG